MDVCILDQSGAVLVPRNLTTDPATCLHVVAPYRQGMVVAVAGMFTWYWLAALWADAGLPFVLGHALSRQALPGGKATNAKSDAHQRATRLRGGRLPQAYVSPAQRRAPRALLRRRLPLAHTRAELLAHGHHTNRPYTLPAIGKKIASKATREGVAERCAEAAVPKSIEVALALLPYDEAWLREVALPIVHTARHHDAHPLQRWPTVPGIGKILSLGLLDAIPEVHRFPRGQEVVSSCRLVQWAREAAGKRSGTSGAKLGQAHLTGAFSEAAVLFLRAHPAAQTYLARWEKKHAKGQA
jgi:hypothetical protein